MGGFARLGINRVITLPRRRCDNLNVDTHLIEMSEATIHRGHHLANVLLLLRIDFLGGSVGEMNKWNAAYIDMGLRHRSRLRNNDVGVDIDGWRGRSPGEAVGIVDTSCGTTITILA